MSDEQHPEIVDIGIPPMIVLTDGELKQICMGQLVNLKEPAVRGLAFELLEWREANAKG
jgi:hypothetical protein